MTNDAAGEALTNSATIEYELTREEVISTVRWHLVHFAHFRRRMVTVLIGVVFGLVLILQGGDGNVIPGGIFMGISLFAFVILGLAYFLVPGRAWKSSAAVGPRVVEFTDEYVHVRTKNTDSTIRWSTYAKALELRQMYMLIYVNQKNMSTFVPKRAFRSSFDESTFRALASRHIAIEHQGPFR